MPAILTTILAWIVESTVARFIWSTIAWWFMTGLIPVVVSKINAVAGDPFSLIPDGCWWFLDTIGFDLWVPAIFSAYVIRFIIRRLPK